MKKIVLAIALFVGFFRLGAQQYYTAPIPFMHYPWFQGIPVVYPIDDQWSQPVPIGFDFYFFGQQYNQLVVGTNGIVSFNLAYANTFCPWAINAPIPSPANPLNSIMFPYQDLNPATGGYILHQVYGSPPNRKFVLSYYQVPMYSCGYPFNGQLVLDEANSNIEVYIDTKLVCGNWNNGFAILGIQDSTGTNAYNIQGHDFPQAWQAFHEGWLFSPDSIPAHNTISGRHYYDDAGDCAFNNNDFGLMGRPVVLNGGADYTFTDMQGYYAINADTGIYTITSPPMNYYTHACPASGEYVDTFATLGLSAANRDFADTVAVHCGDLTVDMGTWGLRACNSNVLTVMVQNNGTIVVPSSSVTVTLNDSTTFGWANVPLAAFGNNSYTFNLGQLNPGASQLVQMHINVGCDTIGTPYTYSATVSSQVAECDPTNDTDTYSTLLVAAWDPNAIEVAAQDPQRGYVTYDEIDGSDELEYVIHFQNTGNAPAIDVRLVDEIPAQLDPTTIVMGAASHSYNWVVINDVLHIDFLQIFLPDSNSNLEGSQGFVKFRIQQRPGNGPGTQITNMANIYFDFNPAVATNDAVNVIPQITGVNAPSGLANLVLFPNPANTYLQVRCPDSNLDQNSLQWQVVNGLGEVIRAGGAINTPFTLDVQGLPTGFYFLRLSDANGKAAAGKFLVR